jgi:hypothetical protein
LYVTYLSSSSESTSDSHHEKKPVRSFNFTFRYIDDVLSLNNSRFGDFVDRIYPIELEIKGITDTDRSTYTLSYTSK